MKFIVFCFLFFFQDLAQAGNWCKVVYNKDITSGNLQEQISKCKNSDNFFIAIHTSYNNSGHLLNSLRKNVLKSEPRPRDPYFTAVCEFRKHFLRK